MTSLEHKKEAPEDLHLAVLTISDSLHAMKEGGKKEDESGKIIQEKIREANFSSERTILPDDEEKIREKLRKTKTNPNIDGVITTGGTGITSRDVTIDAVKEILDKELPGFGELLRRKSYDQVGTSTILTRATAGLMGQKPVFCLPGSPNSVRTGLSLIIPELPHVVKHARE